MEFIERRAAVRAPSQLGTAAGTARRRDRRPRGPLPSLRHRHGVVHRDVKPGNVLITSDGQVKVTDFGIARAVNTEESLTQTGAVMGTATYFSPEQAEGVGVGTQSDIYSLGVASSRWWRAGRPFSATHRWRWRRSTCATSRRS